MRDNKSKRRGISISNERSRGHSSKPWEFCSWERSREGIEGCSLVESGRGIEDSFLGDVAGEQGDFFLSFVYMWCMCMSMFTCVLGQRLMLVFSSISLYLIF